MDRRIAIAFYVLSAMGSLVTACATFYVRAEVMATRVEILERINTAGRDYVRRPEFESLTGRVIQLEAKSHTP